MERLDLGKGRFLITQTPEEIQQLKKFLKISQHLALTAMKVSQRDLSSDPEEIRRLNIDIKSHIEAVDQLVTTPTTS